MIKTELAKEFNELVVELLFDVEQCTEHGMDKQECINKFRLDLHLMLNRNIISRVSEDQRIVLADILQEMLNG